MKPYVPLLSALIIAVTICSCSKNSDDKKESPVLKSYTTTFSNIVYYTIYDRDANNRITSMRDSTKAYEYKTDLIYGSNGKVEKANFIQLGTIAYSYEFTYNSAGRIAKRTIRSGTLAVD